MDYEKKYKEALALMKDCIPDENGLVHVRPDEIFTELKESEDERMRNAAINACKYMVDNFENSTKQYEDAIAWLEKQGEQKHADKFEPKFKVGDKIIGTISNIPYYITELCVMDII